MKKLHIYLMLIVYSWVCFTYNAEQSKQDAKDALQVPYMTDEEFFEYLKKQPNYADDDPDIFTNIPMSTDISTPTDKQPQILPDMTDEEFARYLEQQTSSLNPLELNSDQEDFDQDFFTDISTPTDEQSTTTSKSIKTPPKKRKRSLNPKVTCPECSKPMYSTNLKRHMETHMKTTHECYLCHRTFSDTSNLKRHMKLHAGIKEYECPYCYKQCTQSGHLEEHIRKHTGEKPYECTFSNCHETFATDFIRKQHLRTHTGEKPYACSICPKSFAQLATYNNHMETHTKENTCECPFCNKEFSQRRYLKRHIKNQHSEQTNANVTQNEDPDDDLEYDE